MLTHAYNFCIPKLASYSLQKWLSSNTLYVSVLVICKRSGLTEKMESIDRNSLTSYHSIHSLGHINVNITKLGKLYRVLDHLLYLTTKVQYGRTISSRDFGKSRSEFRLKVCYSPTM